MSMETGAEKGEGDDWDMVREEGEEAAEREEAGEAGLAEEAAIRKWGFAWLTSWWTPMAGVEASPSVPS